MITTFDLGGVFVKILSLGLRARCCPWKKIVRQAKLFRGDLIADSYSAVGQLFFFSLLLTCPACSMTQLPLIWTVLSKSFVNVAMCDKYPAAVLSQALLDRSHCSFGYRIFSR